MPKAIPFMRLDRQFQAIREPVLQRVVSVLQSGNVLQSKEVLELEERVAAICGASYAVAVNSGTDALILTLKAIGLKPGSRIAVTAMSFVASASAILNAGHEPVFVDVDPSTMLMDSDSTIELIDDGRVDAVLAVHLYGQSIDLEPIERATRQRGIPLVEDSAQVLGATRNGKPVGGTGVAGCLSFDPTKVIGAYGSGGAVITNDQELANRLRLLRYHGHAGEQRYVLPGFNSQMDSVQAAILCAKLDHVSPWQVRRQNIADRYNAAAQRKGIRPISVLPGNVHNYHKYVIWADDRQLVQSHLASRGIQTKVQYPIPLHRQPLFERQRQELPNVELAANHILSLPMYAELTDEEVDVICDALGSIPDAS